MAAFRILIRWLIILLSVSTLVTTLGAGGLARADGGEGPFVSGATVCAQQPYTAAAAVPGGVAVAPDGALLVDKCGFAGTPLPGDGTPSSAGFRSLTGRPHRS